LPSTRLTTGRGARAGIHPATDARLRPPALDGGSGFLL